MGGDSAIQENLIASGLRHFSLDEFTHSATAIANGIDNTPDTTKADDRIVVENPEYLCQTVLKPQGNKR